MGFYTRFKQNLIRRLIATMGNVYVYLDKKIIYSKDEIKNVLGLNIDDDLQIKSRYELCTKLEEAFELPKEAFWSLHSTQKIRFAAQMSRNLKGEYNE